MFSGMGGMLRPTAGPLNPLAAAIGGRRRKINYVTDPNLPAESSYDPNFTLKSLQQRKRPGMMSGMGGILGGKF